MGFIRKALLSFLISFHYTVFSPVVAADDQAGSDPSLNNDKRFRGDVIGLSGNSGLSTGPHLHYEMYVDGRPVDAMKAQLRTNRSLAGSEFRDFRQVSVGLLNRLGNKGSLAVASDSRLSEAS